MDPQRHGPAEQAGEQMHSELDAISRRLQDLKRRLEARQSVIEIEHEMATGDAVTMNPLTAEPDPPSD